MPWGEDAKTLNAMLRAAETFNGATNRMARALNTAIDAMRRYSWRPRLTGRRARGKDGLSAQPCFEDARFWQTLQRTLKDVPVEQNHVGELAGLE